MNAREWFGGTVRRLLAVGLAVGVCLLLPAGCGDEKDGGPGKPSGEKALGQKIGDTYIEAMKEMYALIEDKPAAAATLPKAKQIREKYIQMLVGYGRRREKLDAAGKEKVRSDLMAVMMSAEARDLAKKYAKLVNETYGIGAGLRRSPEEQELANVLADMNVITQYAQFELLKKQKPAEAARLGIE